MPEVTLHPQEVQLAIFDPTKGCAGATLEYLELLNQYWEVSAEAGLLAEQYEEALTVQFERQKAFLNV